MNVLNENNKVTLAGTIASEFRFNHELYGEKFYLVDLAVERSSGAVDLLPLRISERMIDVTDDLTGVDVEVIGEYRSHDIQDENGKYRLVLSVFVKEMYSIESAKSKSENNSISLIGVICKEPTYRETPRGREISDFLIAINRPYGKSDYLPCIVWGRNARFVSQLKVGTKVELYGRIQSRTYYKKLEDGTYEVRTAYEVSVNRVNVLGANR